MTLAGTRPILQDELRQYELHHRARIAIKPGITGMWQVSGRSDITDFEEVVRLDTEYISNWNFGLDITAWYIPIIRHLLQHSWWSAWRYVLLGNNKNQERSVKEKNFMVYWERLNVMFGYTWGRHYEIS